MIGKKISRKKFSLFCTRRKFINNENFTNYGMYSVTAQYLRLLFMYAHIIFFEIPNRVPQLPTAVTQ